MAGEGGGAAGVTDGPLGATRGDATPAMAGKVEGRAGAALGSGCARGEGGPTGPADGAGCDAAGAIGSAAIATSRDSSSLTRNPGSGAELEPFGRVRRRGFRLCRRPRGRFGRPRRRLRGSAPPASGFQPRNQLTSAGRAVLGVSVRSPQRLAGVGLRGVAPVAHLAEGVLRRVRSDHLDTADQIAVRAAELGSLRRDGAARRPESKRQERGWPTIAHHQISAKLSRPRIQPVRA